MAAFPEVDKIKYEGPSSDNPLAYHWYNEDEVIEGKSMKDHMRFSVVYWHTFRCNGTDPFGSATMLRPWDDGSESVENACNRARVAFEFIEKLGAPYYAFHDRDVAPEGADMAGSHANLEAVAKVLKEEQDRTGIKLLWGTANMFSNPRYMHGAATTCNADVFAYAAGQVRKCLEITHELGGENYVFWGGREGYQSLFNTDMKRELDHLAKFFHMAVEYADKIGFQGTFLIEPKPKEPTKHQYDSDAAACINFLRAYDLTERFKLNIETNHATLAGHGNPLRRSVPLVGIASIVYTNCTLVLSTSVVCNIELAILLANDPSATAAPRLVDRFSSSLTAVMSTLNAPSAWSVPPPLPTLPPSLTTTLMVSASFPKVCVVPCKYCTVLAESRNAFKLV